jgi:hypothetical protein
MTTFITSSAKLFLLASLVLIVSAFPVRAQSNNGAGNRLTRSFELLNSISTSNFEDNGILPLANDSASEAKACTHLYALGYNYLHGAQWQQCYDTLKNFIELCPTYPQNWRSFNLMLSAATSLWIKDTNYYTRYRSWLKSIKRTLHTSVLA